MDIFKEALEFANNCEPFKEWYTVFLTQIISRQQKDVNAKVV